MFALLIFRPLDDQPEASETSTSVPGLRGKTMDKAQFWRLIEDAKAKSGGDCEEQTQVRAQGLKQLPLE